MALEDVVNVVVNINQATIAQQGFGTPLIYAYHPLPNRVMTFRAGDWSSAMLAEGFDQDSGAYRCAEVMMMQSPRPVRFKVGRATTAPTQTTRLTISTALENTPYRVTARAPDGAVSSVVYVSVPGDTGLTIATGLAAVLGSVDGLTAEATGTEVSVAPAEPDRLWSFYDISPIITVSDLTTVAAGEIEGDLNLIRDLDNDWYALCLTTGAPDAIAQAAPWVESNRKIMVASTADSSVLATSVPAARDIASDIKGLGLLRTHVAYHSRAGQYYGPAWMSAMLPYEPGQADWKFKELKGVTPDKLTATQETALLGKNASYYETLVGEPSTGAAKGSEGTFLDLVQLSDWLRARTTEGIVRMLKSAPKVPFTDQGGGNSIWGVLRNVALQAIHNSAVEEDPTTWSVFVPKKKDLDPALVIARTWDGCILNVTPTGAVHSVGTITVNINVVS
jgi:hypothetical protein